MHKIIFILYVNELQNYVQIHMSGMLPNSEDDTQKFQVANG